MNEKVLLVDDDTFLLKSLARCLEQNGLQVTTSSCAAEARAILNHEEFQAIVCDYQMPGDTGLEFLSEVRQTRPDIDCFVLSGRLTGLDIAEDWAAEIGVKEIFAKPCDAEQIAHRISNC